MAVYVVVKENRLDESKSDVVMITWDRNEAEAVVDAMNKVAEATVASIMDIEEGRSCWM